ncbi:MAG: phosphate acyltransferase, partial [Candidatus Jidaibacter sp.]|nr:phosphate acyltransferase [Candidatus Jidaibacter sp.]
MIKGLVISVDAMGGDNAPASVIEGLELIAQKHSDVFFLIYGKQELLYHMIAKRKKLQGRYRLIDALTVISDNESPIKAYKTGSDSSLRKAIDAVRSGEAGACVSCGNTGALMVTAKMVLGSLKYVKRPAIISIFPNKKDGVVMLDLGANSECEPINFLQFAIMGSCFAKALFQNPNPSVGILNIGVEEHKGRDLEKKASAILQESKLNYKGFIEGYDLSDGSVDVVVTDGFTGNIALKVAEGVANTCM